MKRVSGQKGLMSALLSLTILLGVGYWLVHSGMEMILRGIVSFFVAPLAIHLANEKHIWFRKNFRWVVRTSQSPLRSAALFFVFTLVSYDALNQIPYGFLVHLILLSIGSVIYWSPFMLRCPFCKPVPFMHQFSYFVITSIVFFTYHQMTFYFYQAQPTFLYMIVGIAAMLLLLLSLIVRWANSEASVDRITVEGFIQPIQQEKK
ncbi:hypothetical protein [Halobacillus salinus]|uniref:Uncharacterized protein n=1 Tax=Halobacillus salinus TaxID=192814 RepID=A0A4Z0H1P3_9BACI|nr:hypothetical protein [Halobacillus salinus]TGB02791.1 hypothetical protein E4663_11585 [Halobacillus salinus]